MAGNGGRWFVWPSAREWWGAMRWALVVFTLLVLFALAGSFVSYERVIAEGHPWVPGAHHCAGCPFCGMTRSFCALSGGRWREAVGWNRGGPALYAAAWLWLMTATAFTTKWLAGRWGVSRGREN